MSTITHFINFIYGTNRVVKKFQATHPHEKVIASSAVKAIKSTPKTEVDTGAQWIVSKRTVAILTDKRIKCGDWDIPLETITSSELIPFSGLISKGQLLSISTTNNEGFQLGMQLNKDWLNQEPLNLQYVSKKLKTSTFSWVMRGVLIVYVGYLIYERFVK